MRRRLAIGGGLAVAASVALTAGVAVGAETPYHFSGKTNKNGNGATRRVSCADGYYVRNSGSNSGTIFDAPFIDKSGSAPGVLVGNRPTSSVAWGHPGSRLVTGIEIWVQNDRRYGHQALDYSVTLKCTNNKDDAWVILGARRGTPTSTTETSYTFSGNTNRDGSGRTHNVTCASGHYVKSNGVSPGTIFDDAFIDKSGSAQGVGVGDRATSSVAWGHPGSRLATGIEIWVQNDRRHAHQSLAYRVTVKCTDSQNDAWVIFG